ncbi:winged helix-turn-helix domain-containing protein [Streptomyces sp. DG2A-72]|uniref:winged helix-turn-helix domain-containing protein n=1 Tax=Streptomyces sp. DG2A-72 TaxID=3051386 RepID=UPI00265BC327|nr:winged helix-turn-helix domain-containing protein [Streptomyces sp. DG2A-72]MDO0934252.1 winged helix-turn-helix domain-containing protein [Streptomyces sp. DG2A-72]
MNGNRTSPEEIADDLRERIRVGELKAGERLPTQGELAEQFGVERGTVRQAMRALQKDGLLTNVGKGSPPNVAEVPVEPQQSSRKARVALVSYLKEAFREPEVHIDAICFTAETLMWAIGEMCTAVARREVHPKSVDVRCLLPGPDVVLPYPDPVDRPELRADVHEKLKQQITNQRELMDYYLSTVMKGHGVDAKVTFRPLRFVPSVKQYVLNGAVALQGSYQVGRRTYEDLPEKGKFDVYDVSGFSSLLFEFRRDRGGEQAQFVQDTKNCFDAHWDPDASRQTLT